MFRHVRIIRRCWVDVDGWMDARLFISLGSSTMWCVHTLSEHRLSFPSVEELKGHISPIQLVAVPVFPAFLPSVSFACHLPRRRLFIYIFILHRSATRNDTSLFFSYSHKPNCRKASRLECRPPLAYQMIPYSRRLVFLLPILISQKFKSFRDSPILCSRAALQTPSSRIRR